MQPFKKTTTNKTQLCALGKAVITTEQQAIAELTSRIDDNFANACLHLLQCKGRIVVIGMGKSGHIGNKIAATFASTGSPAFFVHPGEASHGDLGMITSQDCVLGISYSGRTKELLTIVPIIKRLGVPLICLTGDSQSPLAKVSDVHIDVSIKQEACPLGLAPTSSTTACLVMGDALAIALLQARGFTEEDFARTHPAGTLGTRLLLTIDDIMHTGDQLPVVHHHTLINEAIIEITNKRLGMTTVIDDNGKICGIYTDGDLRRTLDKQFDIRQTKINNVMTHNFKTAKPGMLAAEALRIMQEYKIKCLIVTNDSKNCIGIVDLHTLLSAGII